MYHIFICAVESCKSQTCGILAHLGFNDMKIWVFNFYCLHYYPILHLKILSKTL